MRIQLGCSQMNTRTLLLYSARTTRLEESLPKSFRRQTAICKLDCRSGFFFKAGFSTAKRSANVRTCMQKRRQNEVGQLVPGKSEEIGRFLRYGSALTAKILAPQVAPSPKDRAFFSVFHNLTPIKYHPTMLRSAIARIPTQARSYATIQPAVKTDGAVKSESPSYARCILF